MVAQTLGVRKQEERATRLRVEVEVGPLHVINRSPKPGSFSFVQIEVITIDHYSRISEDYRVVEKVYLIARNMN